MHRRHLFWADDLATMMISFTRFIVKRTPLLNKQIQLEHIVPKIVHIVPPNFISHIIYFKNLHVAHSSSSIIWQNGSLTININTIEIYAFVHRPCVTEKQLDVPVNWIVYGFFTSTANSWKVYRNLWNMYYGRKPIIDRWTIATYAIRIHIRIYRTQPTSIHLFGINFYLSISFDISASNA